MQMKKQKSVSVSDIRSCIDNLKKDRRNVQASGTVVPSSLSVNHERLIRQVKLRTMSGSATAAGQFDIKSDESAVLYECRDYSNWTLSMLDAMRLERTLCDVVICVGQSCNIFAHQAVLACNSAFFMTLFQRAVESPSGSIADGLVSFSHNGQNHLYINFSSLMLEEDAFKQLIEYMYCGRVWISERNAAHLYMAASKLCIPPVVKACAKYLQTKITPANALGILTISSPDIVLKELAAKSIRSNFHEVMSSKGFEQLPHFLFEIRGQPVLIEDFCHFAHCVIAYLASYHQDKSDQNLSSLAESTHRIYVDGRDQSGNFKWPSDDEVEASTICGRHFVDHDVTRDRFILPSNEDTQRSHLLKDGRDEIKSTDEESNSSQLYEIIHAEHSLDTNVIGLAFVNFQLISFTIQVKSRTHDCVNNCSAKSSKGSVFERSISCNGNKDKHQRVCEHMAILNSDLVCMSQPRAGLALIGHRNTLIVAGGFNSGSCLDSVEALDLAKLEWSKWPSMKGRRGRCFVARIGNLFGLFGGSNGTQLLTDCEVVNLEDNTWSTLANVRLPLANCTVVSSDNESPHDPRLYALCGSNEKEPSHLCFEYKESTSTWQPIANLFQERINPMAVWHDNNLYVFGGHSTWRCLRKCEMYSPVSNSWRELPDLSEARRSAGIASYKGKIYIIGGTDGTITMSAVEVFNPNTMQWEKGAELRCRRSSPGVLVFDDKIYVVGGFDGRTFQRTIEVFDGETWHLLYRHRSCVNDTPICEVMQEVVSKKGLPRLKEEAEKETPICRVTADVTSKKMLDKCKEEGEEEADYKHTSATDDKYEIFQCQCANATNGIGLESDLVNK